MMISMQQAFGRISEDKLHLAREANKFLVSGETGGEVAEIEEAPRGTLIKNLKRRPLGELTEWADWMQRREKSRMELKQEDMEFRMQKLEHQKQREEDKGERAEKRRIQMEEEDKDREERTKLMELPVNTLKNK